MADTLTESDVQSADAAKLDFSTNKAAKKQHDAIVSWAKTQFRMIRSARVSTERQWYLNLAFFAGLQNVHVLKPQTNSLGNFTSTRLFVPPAPYYRARPVINRIRPTIRHELAQLTNNKPNASIVPASAEDRDLYAAQAGEQIWENIYLDHKLKFVLRRALWWNQVCGNGFIKAWWDPNAKSKDGYQGDVCFTPETPFHVLVPDFREEELESQPFLIHAQSKSSDWVKMNFPKALDGTQLNTGTSDGQDLMDDTYLNMTGTQVLNKQHNVLILECWVKPGATPLFPQGAFFTICGDKIVQGFQAWPFSHGQYPFAKFDHIPSGKFYATSTIDDLISLQKEYNRTRGQIIENKNRMSKQQLLAPRGSVNASAITSEPGQVIEYTPGFDAPKPLQVQDMPSYVMSELDRMMIDWNDISGQHDVSKGQAPPGVTAATAISYLQERDESTMSPTFDSVEEGLEKVARMTLSYVHDYWDVKRMVRTTGPNGSFDVVAFAGSDLGSNLDIRIEAGSSLPVSKAAKQALITDWMKMGFISPQKGMEVLDMGGINKIYESIQVDQKQIQRENLKMSKATAEVLQQYAATQLAQQLGQAPAGPTDPLQDITSGGMPGGGAPTDPSMNGGSPPVDPMEAMQGMQQSMPGLSDPNAPAQPDPTMPPEMPPAPLIVPVNTWDNHKLHIEGHNEYRKSQAFEGLEEDTKALFESHVQQHIAAMGVEMMTQNPQLAGGVPPELAAMGLPGTQPQGGEGGDTINNAIKQGDQPQGAPQGQGQPGPMPMPQMEGPQ
jgi:hypothetical protein